MKNVKDFGYSLVIILLAVFCQLLIPLSGFSQNQTNEKSAFVALGHWKATLKTKAGQQIPFDFFVKKNPRGIRIEILNAAEHLVVDEISFVKDSLFITMPFFDSEFRVKYSESQMNGYWIRHLPGRKVIMPFLAKSGDMERFDPGIKAHGNLTGTWELHFSKSKHSSVGEFTQYTSGKVSGSILNLSGDYRYLEGRLRGDSLFLSTFDGSNALLIKARLDSSGKTFHGGVMYSGLSGFDEWKGLKNPKARLSDPYSLTTLKEGSSKIDFSFMNTNGALVSLSDQRFKGKVIILQFMGSWCPNCMDETAFLARFYEKFKGKVEVIGLAYERTTNFDSSRNSLRHFLSRFHVGYDVLITKFLNKPDQVLKSIPALNNFMAFPTTIILDAKGNVNSIHTGFSGPGTGKYYTEFTEEFTRKIERLLDSK